MLFPILGVRTMEINSRTRGRPRKFVPVERIAALKENGRSLREIAREVNLGVTTVHRALKSLGCEPTPFQNSRLAI